MEIAESGWKSFSVAAVYLIKFTTDSLQSWTTTELIV